MKIVNLFDVKSSTLAMVCMLLSVALYVKAYKIQCKSYEKQKSDARDALLTISVIMFMLAFNYLACRIHCRKEGDATSVHRLMKTLSDFAFGSVVLSLVLIAVSSALVVYFAKVLSSCNEDSSKMLIAVGSVALVVSVVAVVYEVVMRTKNEGFAGMRSMTNVADDDASFGFSF